MKLKWSKIDLKAKTLTVPEEDTKNTDVHSLPLTDFLLEILTRRSEVPRIDTDYVFAAELGSGHIVEPKSAIASVVKNSGVKFSMHTLRRTFATTAEGLDIPFYALKRLLNHRVTSDVTSGYIVTEVERLRPPMQNITDSLKQHMGIALTPAQTQVAEK